MKPDLPENEPSIVRTTPFEEVVSLCEAFTGEHAFAGIVYSSRKK